ncbi:acyl-CoA synthetase [Verminephrobacter aporrectodeae subsp. tuberculatae]|uniref:AMP-binding protein n=1 Tax=Verminephrobacter aporrectodeae TaxID=1110389 RepID=UPI002242D095|nr:AMP-binding protein [Verminephrobacter aporrectodeae]MCW8168797.1 acyl-CoA synthetase [Verminephrobacter aporrectodeae subsp. tuberculatae]
MNGQQHDPCALAVQAHAGGSIGEMIIHAIQRFPERVAFVEADRSIDYAALGRRIGQALAALRSLGLRRGDCVMQLSGNRSDVFAVMAAAYLMGLRSVTLHALGGYEDHAYIVGDAEPSVFLAEAAHRERALALRAACPGVAHWFAHDACADLADFWALALSLEPAPLRSEARPEDIIRLAYTGGTTGRPKGVMLANRSVWMQAVLLMAARGMRAGMRVLCPTPISHGAGAMIVPTLASGGRIILQRGFDPDRFIDALQAQRAHAAFLVPTMIYRLLDHPRCAGADFSSLELLSYGAAPMAPARIREALARFGPVLAQSYGQSECPSNILHLTPEDHRRTDIDVLASAGMPYPGVTVALFDAEDRPVADGAVGELCVRSPLVMDGYWKQPELTRQTLRGGWLHTGDLARRDANGYYHLVDRRKDMLISGGFNVYPREVEDVIAQHPAVAAVAVIGVPDERWGEAVKAVVVRHPGAQVEGEALRALVRQAKGAVCTPKTVDFVDALPLTPLGKPDKKQLRAHYWQGQARAIH